MRTSRLSYAFLIELTKDLTTSQHQEFYDVLREERPTRISIPSRGSDLGAHGRNILLCGLVGTGSCASLGALVINGSIKASSWIDFEINLYTVNCFQAQGLAGPAE